MSKTLKQINIKLDISLKSLRWHRSSWFGRGIKGAHCITIAECPFRENVFSKTKSTFGYFQAYQNHKSRQNICLISERDYAKCNIF